MAQIERTPRDGAMSVNRYGADITLTAEDKGQPQGMEVSEWQAQRLLVALSMVLQLPLSSRALRALRESDDPPATRTRP